MALARTTPVASGTRLAAITRYQGSAALLFRLVLAFIFLLAGASKVGRPWVFVHTVESYNMLPTALARPLGLALPWIELLIGLYLVIGLFTRATALAAAALLSVFFIALSVQIARGNGGECGCFGTISPLVTTLVGGNTIGVGDLVRDGLLLLLAVIVALSTPLVAVDRLLAAWRAGDTTQDPDIA
jgi:uncharacterized membrane protein YphA (DoxX/SURF4 family)